jgi:menaquinol-cytochrome c reductase iron-sulfur subunit
MAARSLNPRAAENVGTRPAAKQPEPPRRNFLMAFAAGAIGTLIALFPVGAGLLNFLDPVLRKKPVTKGGKLLRVGLVEGVPADGTPVQVPVIADLTDGWSKEPNQPIGAVYLRREGEKIVAFNAICPHAGCFVGFDDNRRCFQCPCHTSSFALDGAVMHPSPSPRDMDPLEVDQEKLKQGEVWILFQNYYPGKAEREAKA